MSKTRTRRPASKTRSARRSLVELTATASRDVDDGLFVMPASPIAASPDDPPRSDHAAKTSDPTVIARQATAPVPVAVPESLNAAVSRGDELVDIDSTAEIAKDYQNRAFEDIKVSLNAALDHAKDFAETRVGSEAARDHSGASLNNFLAVLNGAAAEFRAEALGLMKVNVIMTLEYATTTAAEFVELSSAQARKQCELILRQASVLKSLAQTMTKASIAVMIFWRSLA
jgi:hypothetical protein